MEVNENFNEFNLEKEKEEKEEEVWWRRVKKEVKVESRLPPKFKMTVRGVVLKVTATVPFHALKLPLKITIMFFV